MSEISCRSFEFAQKYLCNGKKVQAYPKAQLPIYSTESAAGADFFCAEDVVIPSIWTTVFAKMSGQDVGDIKPTLVHTGIKANMEKDEWLQLANRSSGPKKRNLILANGIGVTDEDYYSNVNNDGEIMFMFYNVGFEDVTIQAGERIGQGIFLNYKRPEDAAHGLNLADVIRTGAFGSTGK